MVDEINMTYHKQQSDEILSAFIDAEQSDNDTNQVIDALLSDTEYKEHYVRLHSINEHLNDQLQANVLNMDVRDNISLALDDLPAHFVDNAVSLHTARTENITQSNGFKRFFENRMLSGVSIAASVMFITLFTLQEFNSGSAVNTTAVNSLAGVSQTSSSMTEQSSIKPIPSLIQQASELPASFASSANISSGPFLSGTADAANDNLKPQYQWIEADPVLSQQIRQYVNEHEMHRAAHNLQPKIRTATYRISD